MDISFQKASVKHLRTLVQYLSIGVILLGVGQIVLGVTFLNREESWVLIPQFDEERQVRASTKVFSKDYLRGWAQGILEHLYVVDAENVEQRIAEVRAVAPEYFGTFKRKMELEAQTVKEQGVSTVFHAKEFEVDRGKGQVQVKGYHHTWYSDDKKPIKTVKTYVLGYRRGAHGIILLRFLKEKKV